MLAVAVMNRTFSGLIEDDLMAHAFVWAKTRTEVRSERLLARVMGKDVVDMYLLDDEGMQALDEADGAVGVLKFGCNQESILLRRNWIYALIRLDQCKHRARYCTRIKRMSYDATASHQHITSHRLRISYPL